MEKTIRAFGRSELAQQYFPQISPMSAWRKFREWLVLNPSLVVWLLSRVARSRQQRYSLSTRSWGSRRNNHFSVILRILFQSKSHLSP